jgi:hypothetical protein
MISNGSFAQHVRGREFRQAHSLGWVARGTGGAPPEALPGAMDPGVGVLEHK